MPPNFSTPAPSTPNDLFQHAVTLHQQGRIHEARALYQQLLASLQGEPLLLHLFGLTEGQLGNPSSAIDYIRRAIAASPSPPAEFYANLARCHLDLHQDQDALAAATEAARRAPAVAEAHINRGVALQRLNRLPEAIDTFRHAMALNPRLAEAPFNLASALRAASKGDDAIAHFRQAISLNPAHAAAWCGLADILNERARLPEAIAAAREAIRLQPGLAAAHHTLGISLQLTGDAPGAIESFRNALRLAPMYEAHNNLGLLLLHAGNLHEAIAEFDAAIRLNPGAAAPLSNRAIARSRAGDIREAVIDYHAAMKIAPQFAPAHSSLIYCMMCDPATTPDQLATQLGLFREHIAGPLPAPSQWPNDRSPGRRLKVGYVSADFRDHSVARFLRPLLDLADPAQVETFCYSNVISPDAITGRLRAAAHHWRDISGIPDNDVAASIRNDQIDILVDLSLHTDRNRLPLFARKPAPLQLTYLAYPGTTGLLTIDYRLTDPYFDPPAPSAPQQAWLDICTEKPLHLPDSYWCYDPPASAPAITETPHLKTNGAAPLTFGCLNSISKMSPDTLDTWAALLTQLPAADLLLHAPEGPPRQRIIAFFTSRGIDPARIRYVSNLPFYDYLALYNQIDIALDTFPCAAGTTSCDAIFMGVPFITLASPQPWGGGGVSILQNVNLPDLGAQDRPHYLQLAHDLASNPARRRSLRHTLRETFLHSPLTNAPQFARNLESLYRRIWQNWCNSPR